MTNYADKDFGTRIRMKCHQQIQRIAKTIEGELCTNWKQIDSFGVRLDFDDSIYHTDRYKDFYGEISGDGWEWSGTGLRYNVRRYKSHLTVYKAEKENFWVDKYVTVNHRSLYGEKGFILKNGIFERFESIGITWNDSYCRRITDLGPSGCFVERELSTTTDFNYQENNCTGKDSTNLLEG